MPAATALTTPAYYERDPWKGVKLMAATKKSGSILEDSH
jgi:hypothetical protein